VTDGRSVSRPSQVLLLQQESREGRKRVAQLEKDTKELQRSEAAARAAAAESEMLQTEALRVAEQLEVCVCVCVCVSSHALASPLAGQARESCHANAFADKFPGGQLPATTLAGVESAALVVMRAGCVQRRQPLAVCPPTQHGCL
jgi:hypothetical protein